MVRAVDHAVRTAVRWPKIAVRLLVAVVIVLVGVCGVLTYNVIQNRNESNSLRQDSINSCESGNITRQQQTEVWEKNYSLQAQESKTTGKLLTELIAAIAQNNPVVIKQIDTILVQSGKANAAETQQFLNYVKQVNADRNCAQEYATGSAALSGS